MGNVLAAVLAFGAFGACLLSAAVLLLLNPRNTGVRWYTAFEVVLLLWLLGQGMDALHPHGFWFTFMNAAAFALPGYFIAYGHMVDCTRPTWQGLVITGLATIWGIVLSRPAVLAAMGPLSGQVVTNAWLFAAWTTGAILTWRFCRRLELMPVVLFVAAPVFVCVGVGVAVATFRIYALPPLMLLIQFLVFVAVVRLRFYDIDVRVRRSGELATEAAEGQRLAVLGELAAVVAHEVRNPLTGVRSLAQRLAEEQVEDDRRRRWAGLILEETARVERLVSNLLDVARRAPRPAGPARTELAPLFDDLALLVGARATRAGVTLLLEPRGLTAAVPREPLAQALLNLLLNAIAHSPAGGRVELLAQRAEEPGEGAIELLVRDQGPGIPVAERERVFDAFQSARAGGTGLGLSIVRRLVTDMGGRVQIADAPAGGAELRLRLPGAYRPAEPPEAAAAETSPAHMLTKA